MSTATCNVDRNLHVYAGECLLLTYPGKWNSAPTGLFLPTRLFSRAIPALLLLYPLHGRHLRLCRLLPAPTLLLQLNAFPDANPKTEEVGNYAWSLIFKLQTGLVLERRSLKDSVRLACSPFGDLIIASYES